MAELARRSKLKQPSLWAIEHQRTKKPKGDTLINIAVALEVPLRDILAAHPEASRVDLRELYQLLNPQNRTALIAAAEALLKSQK